MLSIIFVVQLHFLPQIIGSTQVVANTSRPEISDQTSTYQRKRILCFGDSLTRGLVSKAEPYHPYTIKLSELLNKDETKNNSLYFVYNEGVRRECVSPNMTARLPLVLHEYGAIDLVVILGGTNDLGKNSCPNNTDLFESIKSLHEKCLMSGVHTVAVTIPEADRPVLPRRAANHLLWLDVNDKLRSYAAANEHSVILCDLAKLLPLETLSTEKRKELWSDSTHLTAAGYDAMGTIIYNCIKDRI